MIDLEDIHVYYDTGLDSKICALRVHRLNFRKGEWCNIIGPNGSGKSTLLRVLSGGVECFEGRIRIENRDVGHWKTRNFSRLVQLLDQNPEKNIVPSMTVEENLFLYQPQTGFRHFAFLRQGCSKKLENFLSGFQMDIESRLASQAGLLSGGQKQAVALAAVLLRCPRILLLDEFLAAIDPQSAPKLLAVVKKIARDQEITVITVTHNLKQIEISGGRLICLSSGNVADDIDANSMTQSEILSRYTSVINQNGLL